MIRTAIVGFSSLVFFSSCMLFQVVRENKRFTKFSVTDNHQQNVIPFEIEKGRIVVRTYVVQHGKKVEGKFVLDTGAPSLLSENFTIANGIQLDKSLQVVETPTEGLKVDRNAQKANAVMYRFGDMDVLFNAVRVIPHKTSDSCNPIDGIIGIDILKQKNICINYAEKTITTFDKTSAFPVVNSEDSILSLSFIPNKFGTPIIQLGIAHFAGNFKWDMGYNGGFIYQFSDEDALSKYITQLPEGLEKFETSGQLSSAFSIDTALTFMYIGHPEEISVQNIHYRIPASRFIVRHNPNLDEDRGNIGMAFMQNFTNYIDWGKKVIYLKRQTRKNTPALKELTVRVADTRQCYVSMINIASDWYRKGLRAGDKILQLDDTAVSGIIMKNERCMTDSVLNTQINLAKSVKFQRSDKIAEIVRD